MAKAPRPEQEFKLGTRSPRSRAIVFRVSLSQVLCVGSLAFRVTFLSRFA